MPIVNECFNHQTLLFMSRIRHWHDEVGCDNRNLIYNNRQLRSELKLEQKFNLRDAVYCLPQRYNSINGFCNFSNGATFKEVKEKFHKTLILASKVKYNTSFFLFSGNYCVPLEGQGWNHVFCLTFEEWRKYWMYVSSAIFLSYAFEMKFNLNFKTSVFIWLAIFWRLF